MDLEFTSDKEKQLAAFIEKYKSTPSQNSKEWHEMRKLSFGGSEIASLIGKNKYKSAEQLLYEKVVCPFEGNDFCTWGKLFEDIHRKILSAILLSDITVFGSIKSDLIEGLHYSPDGLALISLENLLLNRTKLIGLDQFLKDDKLKESEFIVLIEQKSPAKKNIFMSKTVPSYYIPQVLSGLGIINICDFAIYSESYFKICDIIDLYEDNKVYIEYFESDDNTIIRKQEKKNPILYGIAVLNMKLSADEKYFLTNEYANKLKQINLNDYDAVFNFIENENSKFLLRKDLFKNIEMLSRGKYDDVDITKYVKYNYNEWKSDIINHISFNKLDEAAILDLICESRFIPWKLFGIKNYIVETNKNFMSEIKPYVEFGLDTLKECYKMDDNDKKIAYIRDKCFNFKL